MNCSQRHRQRRKFTCGARANCAVLAQHRQPSDKCLDVITMSRHYSDQGCAHEWKARPSDSSSIVSSPGCCWRASRAAGLSPFHCCSGGHIAKPAATIRTSARRSARGRGAAGPARSHNGKACESTGAAACRTCRSQSETGSRAAMCKKNSALHSGWPAARVTVRCECCAKTRTKHCPYLGAGNARHSARRASLSVALSENKRSLSSPVGSGSSLDSCDARQQR